MTFYDILEVSPNASKEVIKMAYKALAKRYHPDLNPPELKEQCDINMSILNEARRILLDDELRMQYDLELVNSVNNENVKDDKEENINENVINEDFIKPHPWIRYFARMMDMCIYTVAIVLVFIILTDKNINIFQDTNKFLDIAILYVLSIVIESILLSTWGTTLGKWVFNSKVVCVNGEKLSFSSALKRTYLVYIKGMALGVPILNLIAMAICYQNLLNPNYMGFTQWDVDTSSMVLTDKRKNLRIVLTLLIFISILVVGSYYSNYNQKQAEVFQQEVNELNKMKVDLDKEYRFLADWESDLKTQADTIDYMAQQIEENSNGDFEEYIYIAEEYNNMIENYKLQFEEFEKRRIKYNKDTEIYNKRISELQK